MKSKEVAELIHNIAVKYDLHPKVVEKVVTSQFKFLNKVLIDGNKRDTTTYKSLLLYRIGTFLPRPFRLKEHGERHSKALPGFD